MNLILILDKRRRWQQREREERIKDDFGITLQKYKLIDYNSWYTKFSYVVRKNIIKVKAFEWFIMGALVINSLFIIFKDRNYDNPNYDPDKAGDSQAKQDVQLFVSNRFLCFNTKKRKKKTKKTKKDMWLFFCFV